MGATLGPKAVQQIEEIVRRHLSSYRNTAGHRRRYTGQEPAKGLPSTGLVRVRNDSGSEVDQFGVLAISDSYYEPITEADDFAKLPPPVLGVSPDEENDLHLHKFCVTIEEIAADEWGLAVVSGIVPCKVYFPNGTIYAHADIASSVRDKLEARGPNRLFGSAYVLWRDDTAIGGGSVGDKTYWCLVRLSNPTSPPPGCGEKPLVDNFIDDAGVSLDDHVMDKGCGWLPLVGDISTELILDGASNAEAVAGVNASAFTLASSAASTVVIDFHMGQATDLNVNAFLRVVSTNTFWFAQARAQGGSNSTFRLIEKTAGTNTFRVNNTGLTMPYDVDYQMTVSDSGVGINASITGGVSSSGNFASTLHANGKGVGFGAVVNSGVYSVTTKIKKWQCV